MSRARRSPARAALAQPPPISGCVPTDSGWTDAGAASPGTGVTCGHCQAICCRLEVLLITETGVPEEYVATDRWGAMSMARLDDGWCAAVDRSTWRCRIYDRRPWVCREFEMGGPDCLEERAGYSPDHGRPDGSGAG